MRLFIRFAVCFVVAYLALSFVLPSITEVLTSAIIEPVEVGKTYTNNAIPISITTSDATVYINKILQLG